MAVRKSIDRSVEQNALLNPFPIVLPVFSFNEIADKVPDQEVFVAEGQKCMGQMVQVRRFTQRMK
jgi:hypothetical protein